MTTHPAAERGAQRIDLAEIDDFNLGALRVSPARRQVCMDGQQRELEPRVAQVLVALALARPAVVSRERLIEQCWDGRIVGDDALNRCILALRHLAKDFSPEPFSIATVPRVGYSLEVTDEAKPSRWRGRNSRALLAGMLVVAVVMAVAGPVLWFLQSSQPQPASIAVLPFRNLGSGDQYFAEGIGEEISGQLAREPQFRVAGSRSAGQVAANADLQSAARQLHVDYVVEGTVHTRADRVRVNAHLMRAKDGLRLWTNSYDGDLDDVFAIQREIGTEIAGALTRKLARTSALPQREATNGKTYNLYLTARGLIRTRNRTAGPTAVNLLRDALQIDPNYASAWAQLGQATLLAGALEDQNSFVASASKAQGYARHAVKLAPDLAEARGALGSLVGFGTPEALANLRRAAELEPNNADNLVGLGAVYGATGEFEKEIDAYRRAREIDPLWFRPVSLLAVAMTEVGNRAGAEALVRRSLPATEVEHHLLLGKIARHSGDYSEAVRRWSIVVRANSPRWSNSAGRYRNEAVFALGIMVGPLVTIPRPLDQRHLDHVWMTKPPTASEWEARNQNAVASAVYRDDNHVAAKLMFNAGRTKELSAAYNGAGGLIGIRRGVPLRADQLSEVPIVALSLRSAGRGAEADRLLRQAVVVLHSVDRRGPVPFWFDADVAGLWAALGRTDQAVSRLSRAYDRGWRHAGATDLGRLDDEPALRSLNGNPKFERLSARLSAHLRRERAETIQTMRRQRT